MNGDCQLRARKRELLKGLCGRSGIIQANGLLVTAWAAQWQSHSGSGRQEMRTYSLLPAAVTANAPSWSCVLEKRCIVNGKTLKHTPLMSEQRTASLPPTGLCVPHTKVLLVGGADSRVSAVGGVWSRRRPD